MSNSNPPQTPRQLSLFDHTDFYYPLYLAKKYQKPLAHHFVDNALWGSVIDWLTILTGDREKALQVWKDRSRGDSVHPTDAHPELIDQMDYIGSDGKTYQALFAHEVVLYALAQDMRNLKTRPAVQEVKEFLQQAGLLVGEMFRNPELAAEKFRALAEGRKQEFESLPADDLKKYRRLIASGYTISEADQWMQFDKLGREAYRAIAGEWYRRDGDIPKLANTTTEIATGFTATELKQQWKIKDSPRNYLSTVEKAILNWIETVSASVHKVRNSQGTSQLMEDIQEIGGALDQNKLAKLKDTRVKRPLPEPEQRKLLKPGNDDR